MNTQFTRANSTQKSYRTPAPAREPLHTSVGLRRAVIFLVFVLAFFMSQFFRHANAVISRDISSEFALTAGQLGLMTSLFYLAFAAAQLPLGGLLDRHGPRLVTPLVMVAAVPGCFLFASAHAFPELGAGRALIGLGMSGVLMGAYMAFGAWFPPQRFATLAGLMVGLGSLGGLGAAAPLAWLNAAVGWRAVFYVSGGLVLLSAGSIALWARDPTRGKATASEKGARTTETITTSEEAEELGCDAAADIASTALGAAEASSTPLVSCPDRLGTVLRTRAFWRISPMYFWMPGTMLAVQGLWAGPFLYDVLRLSPLRVGSYLMLISVGVVVGNLVSGFLGDRFGPGRVVSIAAVCFLASQIGLMALALRPVEALVPFVYFLFGYAAGHQVLLLAHARSIFPRRVAGRVLTGVNMFAFLGATVLQWTMGLVIGAFGRSVDGHYPPQAYLAAFGLTAAGLLLALSWYAPLAWARRGERSGRH